MTTPRIQKLSDGLEIYRSGKIPINLNKARLMTESMRQTEGQPTILRSAQAFRHVVENAHIFIRDGELIVGNPATQPWGGELTPLWGLWPEDEIASLEEEGYRFTAEDKALLREINEFWKGRTLTSRMADLYDDDVLWPYAQLGIVLPAFRSKEEGWGAGGLLGGGYGIHHEISNCIHTADYEAVFRRGLKAMIAEARAELKQTRLFSAAAVRKSDFLRAGIIALEATIGFANRFSALAAEMAASESDPVRRQELLEISEICARVPAEPARTLREAMQAFWFMFLVMCPSTTLGMGRMDQIFYPWYKADREAGRITDDQVVELFALLRLRSMEIAKDGGRAHRSKWAGGAKWHNCTIGGQTSEGLDATNELSFLILDAALACPTPHHTITMRVHEKTPKALIRKALEVARTGIGMPSFIGDPSMVDYLLTKGIAMPEARDYNISGSLNVSLAGASRLTASPMFLLPRVLKIAMDGGVSVNGEPFGPVTRPLEDHATFEEFLASFKVHLDFYLKCQAEFNNVTVRSVGERFPRPIDSFLMKDAVAVGADIFERRMPYDNSNHVNPIGISNTAESLVAIRNLVFGDKRVGGAELRQLLKDNWAGERGEQVRRWCEEQPKFGNDDDRVDLVMADLFRFIAETVQVLPNVTGGTVNPSALTIGTSPWPGGVITGATPDGRRAEDPLCEEALTPTRGREQHGPWEVIASALKIDQLPYHIAELDLRFSRGALGSDEALDRLEDMLRTYFRAGGKHIQFNVYDVAELTAAMADPEAHKDLIVRLGGTSAYFVHLNEFYQSEILRRSQFTEMPPRPVQA